MTQSKRATPTATSLKGLDALGVKLIVNACGCYTDLGGSILSPGVWAALTELNEGYVDIVNLLEATGVGIAALVKAEAARVTPGASAGIALSTAAAMAGAHGPNWEQLPDTTGMRNEILLQRPQARRYQYLSPIRISGAKPTFAGTDERVTLDDVRRAITDRTAALFVPAHLDAMANVLPMEEIAAVAHQHGLPLLVDAAYQVHPPALMQTFAARGADLTMFSSKYFGGPNAGGLVSGSKALIDIIAGLDFTKYESGPYRTFGRPFKMGRFDIAGVYLALKEWFETDHAALWSSYRAYAQSMADGLKNVPGLNARLCCFTLDERIVDEPVTSVLISLNVPGLDAAALLNALRESNPPIYAVAVEDKALLNAEALRPGDDAIIVRGIKEIVARASRA